MRDYTRDAERIRSLLIEKDGKVYAKDNLKIWFPRRFTDIGLAIVSDKISTMGYFCIIDESTKTYGVMNVPAKMQMVPSDVTTVTYEEVEYYELEFLKDTVVFPTMNVVRDETVAYGIINEFYIMGKVPWYMGYEDLAGVLDKAQLLAGSNLNQLPVMMEVITSINGRDKRDISVPIRYTLKSTQNVDEQVDFIGLKEVMYAVPGIINKLLGSYAEDGITSALVEDPSDISKAELALRK